MAIALVAHVGAVSSAINTTGSTLLIGVVSNWSAAVTSVTLADSNANTWHRIAVYSSGASDGYIGIFYAYDKSGSALVVGASHTFTLSGATIPAIAVMSFSGTLTGSDPYDTNVNGASSTSSPASTFQPGSVTPGQSDSLIISGISGNITSFAINSSFTKTDTTSYGATTGGGGAYLIQVGAASAINPAWTMQSSGIKVAADIACFKPAAGGVTTSLFLTSKLAGIGAGGPFFRNPVG